MIVRDAKTEAFAMASFVLQVNTVRMLVQKQVLSRAEAIELVDEARRQLDQLVASNRSDRAAMMERELLDYEAIFRDIDDAAAEGLLRTLRDALSHILGDENPSYDRHGYTRADYAGTAYAEGYRVKLDDEDEDNVESRTIYAGPPVYDAAFEVDHEGQEGDEPDLADPEIYASSAVPEEPPEDQWDFELEEAEMRARPQARTAKVNPSAEVPLGAETSGRVDEDTLAPINFEDDRIDYDLIDPTVPMEEHGPLSPEEIGISIDMTELFPKRRSPS